MSEVIHPPVRFPRLRLQVNLFFLLAVLLVAAFVGLVAYKQGWLVKKTTIHFVTMDALGIARGMPVKLFGLTVGSVRDLAIGDEGVEVRLEINSEYMPRILKGSRARFSREAGVVGASVIEIVPVRGSRAGLVPLAEGSRIDFERSRGITEIVEEFRRQAAPALTEMRQTFSQINRSSDDAAATLSTLRREAERLPETTAALRRLIGDANRAAVEASQTLDRTRRAVENLEREAPVIAGKLSVTLDSINAAAGQVRETARDGGQAVRQAGPLLSQAEAVAREGREVIDAVKRTWPVSGALREARDPALPVDSFEGRATLPPR